MEPSPPSRPSVAGYLVALVGAAGWVVGCFLPLYHLSQLDGITLVRQVSFAGLGAEIGGYLYLFGGIAAIGVVSIMGVLRVRSWTGVLLAGAVTTWLLTSAGVLISLGSSLGGLNPGAMLGIGYWCCWASMAVVVAGTVMVFVSASREDVAAP